MIDGSLRVRTSRASTAFISKLILACKVSIEVRDIVGVKMMLTDVDDRPARLNTLAVADDELWRVVPLNRCITTADARRLVIVGDGP